MSLLQEILRFGSPETRCTYRVSKDNKARFIVFGVRTNEERVISAPQGNSGRYRKCTVTYVKEMTRILNILVY